VIVGTTDTDYWSSPEKVRVDASDVAYVLRTVNDSFPALALCENDIISSWAGLRPLIANPDGSPSDISRAHQIVQSQPGWWDVSGGKLTTYRLMAEQTVDQIVGRLGLTRSTPKCRTADEPLLPPTLVMPHSATIPPPCDRQAVEHYVRNEWALHLEDVMVRRSSWHYYHAEPNLADEVASWMAELHGWSPAERQQELVAYRQAAGNRAGDPVESQAHVSRTAR
jgi:glycerol-3-phosphate dehydrogenase